MNGEADFCGFPECAAPPAVDSAMCQLHARVTVSSSYVNDRHSEGGHG